MALLQKTMSCAREARNAVTAAVNCGGGRPVYVAWSLNESPGCGLRSGESIADAVGAISHLPIAAYMFNCSTPEAITVALDGLLHQVDLPVGAYPNRLHIPEGWTLDNTVQTGVRELSPSEFAAFGRQWAAAGASLVGGCCGIGPEHIAALAAELGT